MYRVDFYKPDEHYSMLCEWWAKQGWDHPPSVDMLPSFGFMVYNTAIDQYVYAGFIIYTSTPIVWLEWLVSNPFVDPIHKRRALKEGLLFAFDIIRTRKPNNRVVFTTTLNSGLVNSLKKCNFLVGDTDMTQLIYEL